MRKYEMLKVILQSQNGISPNGLSKRLDIALPNVYTYLAQLLSEGLITKLKDGSYTANKTNEKTGQLMDLQAMSPDNFHKLISVDFKLVLEQLCKNLKTEGASLTEYQSSQIENIAIPLRIALKISKRPVVYSLKLNESLVATLLRYHDLEPTFTILDFQKMIGGLRLVKPRDINKPIKSDSEVKEMCDRFYKENKDDLISRVSEFKLDDRLTELLKVANDTNKEYTLFVNALDENTRVTLKDQWEKRYIYNTNSIEGNTMSEDEVNEFLKNGKEPEEISRREIYETSNTSEALRFLKIKSNEDIDQDLAKELHFMIQKNIDETPGNYKNIYNYIRPNSPTTPPQHVKQRMEDLIEWYKKNEGKTHPFILASIFHMQFETIHPFADGNGRVGRLLMNHILMRNNHLPVTIMEKTRQNYYRALENGSLQQFLLYSLSGFIEEYKR